MAGPDRVLALQRLAGNKAVAGLLGVQRQLSPRMSAPGGKVPSRLRSSQARQAFVTEQRACMTPKGFVKWAQGELIAGRLRIDDVPDLSMAPSSDDIKKSLAEIERRGNEVQIGANGRVGTRREFQKAALASQLSRELGVLRGNFLGALVFKLTGNVAAGEMTGTVFGMAGDHMGASTPNPTHGRTQNRTGADIRPH